MAAKKAAAKETAVKAKEKKETKKAEVKEAVAAKKAEVKAKVEKTAAEKPVKAAAKKAAENKPVKAAIKKAAPKKTEKKNATPEVAAVKVTSIFKAIEAGDIVSFEALVATQKNKRGDFGRTPLMVISLIRSNPALTDGSNYETKRVKGGKEIYDRMYQLLLDAKCDKNAMDDAGNTARDYNYGGILNQMLAD